MPITTEIAEAFSLDGKVAVVTGGGSGIGREIGRMLGLCGAQVVVCDIDTQGLASSLAIYRDRSITAHSYRADVASKAEVDALAAFALDRTGRLDIWVNCAAKSSLHSILDTDPVEAQQVIAVNLFGFYWGCMAAGSIMAERGGGNIINISSAGGMKPVPNLAVYGMSKAAINSLTMTAAKEFGPMGIRVNAIAPGFVETRATALLYQEKDGSIDPQRRDSVLSEIAHTAPLGRIGHVSDIGRAAVYLASEASSFVTGQVLRVNGGESM